VGRGVAGVGAGAVRAGKFPRVVVAGKTSPPPRGRKDQRAPEGRAAVGWRAGNRRGFTARLLAKVSARPRATNEPTDPLYSAVLGFSGGVGRRHGGVKGSFALARRVSPDEPPSPRPPPPPPCTTTRPRRGGRRGAGLAPRAIAAAAAAVASRGHFTVSCADRRRGAVERAEAPSRALDDDQDDQDDDPAGPGPRVATGKEGRTAADIVRGVDRAEGRGPS